MSSILVAIFTFHVVRCSDMCCGHRDAVLQLLLSPHASHVANNFASYVKIPTDFPCFFFQIARYPKVFLEPPLPKCPGESLSAERTLKIYLVPARDFP